MHAKHPNIQLVCSGERPFAHQRIRNRSVHFPHKLANLFPRPGKYPASADKDKWFLGLADHPHRMVKLCFTDFFRRLNRLNLHSFILCFICGNILGDIY